MFSVFFLFFLEWDGEYCVDGLGLGLFTGNIKCQTNAYASKRQNQAVRLHAVVHKHMRECV